MNLVNEGVLPPDELDDRDERREEQELARSRETVADIVAAMRDAATSAEAWHASMDANVVMDYADRVETAARRERDHAVEHATRHAEAVARDNCRDCVHNPSGHNFEGGNAAAMCDIVTALANVILPPRGKADEDGWLAWVRAMQGKARAALSAPARNCDVGTAEEQSERMEKSVCSKHYGCVKCPYHRNAKYGDCSLKWAQMPYTAGEISRAHRAGEHNNNNKPNNKGSNDE